MTAPTNDDKFNALLAEIRARFETYKRVNHYGPAAMVFVEYQNLLDWIERTYGIKG